MAKAPVKFGATTKGPAGSNSSFAAQKKAMAPLPPGSHTSVLRSIQTAGIHPNAKSAIKGPGQK